MHIIIKSIFRVCLKFNVEKNNRMTAYVWAISGYVKSFPKGTAAGPSGLRVQHLLYAASTSHDYLFPAQKGC